MEAVDVTDSMEAGKPPLETGGATDLQDSVGGLVATSVGCRLGSLFGEMRVACSSRV